MAAPCGGCPPHCNDCVFSPLPEKMVDEPAQIILARSAYNCTRPDGGAVVKIHGTPGMMRGGHFHPVTERGKAFLRRNNNPLAVHC